MHEHQLATLVAEYQRLIQPRLRDELAFYRRLPSLEASVEYAVLAKLPSGKRHPHQRRLKHHVLQAVHENIQANTSQLEQSVSFEDVIDLVRACAVPGFGELAIYDTALRLAARLGWLPQAVYLHAGTRRGAAALRLSVDGPTIAMEALPATLRTLEPDDVENFLCIYKDRLSLAVPSDQPMPQGCVPRSCRSEEAPPFPTCATVIATEEPAATTATDR